MPTRRDPAVFGYSSHHTVAVVIGMSENDWALKLIFCMSQTSNQALDMVYALTNQEKAL